jgi:mannose-6-phosphate isomerase-like protein (cupin superfamily)
MSSNLFGFKKNEINKMDTKFIYISKSKYESDWHSTMHTHSFTELFYVLNGSGIFKIENEELNVKENDLVIVNPHVSHTESSKDSNPLEYIVIGIDGLSLTTEYSMDQISQIVGFTSQSYFNQIFKKRVGICATQYRNQFKGNHS